jgi:hypothetical protein
MDKIVIFLAILSTVITGHPFGSNLPDVRPLNTTSAIEGNPVYFKFSPSLGEATCGGVYPTSISVTFMSDVFTIGEDCLDFINLIGGKKANTKVDVIILCPGTEPEGVGEDEDKTKVMLFTKERIIANPDIANTQWADVTLQATSRRQNKVVAAQAGLSVKALAEGGFKINEMAC